MKRFTEGENRYQSTLFPDSLEDYIAEDNSIRVVDAFVDKLELTGLGFESAEPSATGRPGYEPARDSTYALILSTLPKRMNTSVLPRTGWWSTPMAPLNTGWARRTF